MGFLVEGRHCVSAWCQSGLGDFEFGELGVLRIVFFEFRAVGMLKALGLSICRLRRLD